MSNDSDQAVATGLNDGFLDQSNESFYLNMFENESRSIFSKRKQIVDLLQISKGWTVADVGAGTGIFMELLANAVGSEGQVYEIDLSPVFIERLKTVRDELSKTHPDVKNVVSILQSNEKDVCLPESVVDVVIIVDTYHHFEYPVAFVQTVKRALKRTGFVVIIDFDRQEASSSSWVLNHVRCDRKQIYEEMKAAGFKVVRENFSLLKVTPEEWSTMNDQQKEHAGDNFMVWFRPE